MQQRGKVRVNRGVKTAVTCSDCGEVMPVHNAFKAINGKRDVGTIHYSVDGACPNCSMNDLLKMMSEAVAN